MHSRETAVNPAGGAAEPATVEEIGLPEASRALGFTWHRTWARLLAGELEGRKDAAGHWRVTRSSVDRLRAKIERDRTAA